MAMKLLINFNKFINQNSKKFCHLRSFKIVNDLVHNYVLNIVKIIIHWLFEFYFLHEYFNNFESKILK